MNRDPKAWARLGQALAAARRAQGLTQDELAARAGVSLGSVQRAESGVVPKTRMPITLHPIARALGWPTGAVDAILAGAESPGDYENHDVQRSVNAERYETIISGAMVRALKGVSVDDIRAATKIALDALRREHLL
ncbi:helix-turn-helix domain-containing protein [Streptomyces thermodiastaticus]|uniref:helix-turn-helix domain-containing protein n=1 Tax=Streptomyces thermodiastaticus TaxID=44061 RepID=UPI001671FB87|nr:helix-turn-helix transcriptional regulator [Streptomyces thermodiastaticus]MCE7550869.1 helix-turn-helix domain-containing protein [Streptomyces thermodiastaticus]GHF74186.1 hypothetical protein GCM10018787_23640 [Streptomyces thermodiastaticus]